MARMTDTEMFELVASVFADSDVENADEVIEWANNKAAMIAARAERAAARAATKEKEPDPLYDVVKQILTDNKAKEFLPADITALIDGGDVSDAKVRARCIRLCKEGLAQKVSITVGEKVYVGYQAIA